ETVPPPLPAVTPASRIPALFALPLIDPPAAADPPDTLEPPLPAVDGPPPVAARSSAPAFWDPLQATIATAQTAIRLADLIRSPTPDPSPAPSRLCTVPSPQRARAGHGIAPGHPAIGRAMVVHVPTRPRRGGRARCRAGAATDRCAVPALGRSANRAR